VQYSLLKQDVSGALFVSVYVQDPCPEHCSSLLEGHGCCDGTQMPDWHSADTHSSLWEQSAPNDLPGTYIVSLRRSVALVFITAK
jgi:hypothetical protein